MKAIGRFALIAVIVLAGVPAGAQALSTVYSHDFDTPVGSEWSNNLRTTTPNAARTFLGRFSGENVTLNLVALPEHCAVTVTFDLLIINSWEGSVGYHAGPDIWDLNASVPSDCCPVQNLEHTTFANCSCRYQAFPDRYPHAYNPGLTAADEIDTLAYEHDSVYYVSYTFYHHQGDLQLSFSGSSDLQGWLDETWGIDNIVVEVDAESCCRAARHLPTTYGPGTEISVAIDVVPNPEALAYVLEEDPPGWWSVSAISDGGYYDPTTRTIKWGPYFENTPRTVQYNVDVPADMSAIVNFRGNVSVDGETEIICGDTQVRVGSYHPADTDEDWSISADEVSAYAAAWRVGDEWPRIPAVIPADFITNAGLIWKAGQVYAFDTSVSPPWLPSGGAKAGGGSLHAVADTTVFSPGVPVQISLKAQPDAGTLAYIVEETVPEGWEVVDAGDGFVESRSGVLRFGPYFDDAARDLTYQVMPLAGARGITRFEGKASFDGVEVPADGLRLYQVGVARSSEGRAAAE
ncbi:MAG: hypothetical protein K8R59_11195 [Thermoanaerobaculales bacterium]|nr:hypothetical protein [Thermoanaerobaculales bacterium]